MKKINRNKIIDTILQLTQVSNDIYLITMENNIWISLGDLVHIIYKYENS